jgi:hypothetical protein
MKTLRIVTVVACIVAIAVVGAMLLVAVTTLTAHAAQCGCPPPTQPPSVPQPLPPLQPGGGYVWMAWVGK